MTRPAVQLPPSGPRYQDPALYAQLVWCEGRESHLYKDVQGNWTGGIGWNFTANGLPDWTIELLYDQALAQSIASLDRLNPWWRSLDPVRSRAVLNLMFNMGPTTWGHFVQFRTKLQAGDWEGAGAALRDSLWFGEVGKRGPMVWGMIVEGVDPVLG